MKKILLFIATFLVINSLCAQIPSGYYDNATGSGYTLKTQLYNIIKDHTSVSYTPGVWDAIYTTDVKDNGYVWDMYSDIPGGTPSYDYTLGSDQCGNYSGEGSCYNREHSFPKSWFDDASPMYTELFHIFPTDGYVNGKRSNYPFGEVGSASWTSTNGSKLGTCNYPGYSGTVFEPIDEYKGDFARAYFYMATRYENVISGWEKNDPNGDEVLDGSSDHVYENWFLNMIIEWHNNDPVSQKEIDRNDAVYAIQNNRNPFIDHPEYVCAIWGGCGAAAPQISDIIITPSNPKSSESVSVSANITDDGTITSASLKWGINSGSLSNTISMSYLSGNTYTATANIPAQANGVSVYYKIEATDNELETTISQEQSYTVSDQIIILSQDFESCPASGWIEYSSASNKNWTCGDGYQSINAYGGDVASDDWLISSAVNLDSYSNEILSFSSWTRYTDTFYPSIELLYSVDYSGSGNPSDATWQKLNTTWSNEDSQSWTESGNIDISGINGEQVYFAFHYTSSGTGGGSSAWWEIDNVKIQGVGNQSPVISNLSFAPTNPESADNVIVRANISDSDGSIKSANIKWGTSTGNYPNTVNMSGTGTDFSGTIPKQNNGETIYFVIYAEDNEGSSAQTEEESYTVSDPNQLPEITNISSNPVSPNNTEDVTITANISDSDGTIQSAKISWGTSSGSLGNNVSMSNTSGDNYSGVIPAQTGGTVVYYTISATDNGSESTTSSEQNYTVAVSNSIDGIEFENMKIYPNPTSDKLTIDVSDLTIHSISIYNLIGERILVYDNINQQQKQVDLSSLIKGFYFIKIESENESAVRKIMLK